MKICPRCGLKESDEYTYCQACGTLLTTYKEYSGDFLKDIDFDIDVADLEENGLILRGEILYAEEKYEEAIEYLTPLATNDNPRYQFLLGNSFEELKNAEEAIYWYETAANQDDDPFGILSIYKLGSLYDNGILVKEDPNKAFEYFKIAAEKGVPDAQYRLACFYDESYGVVSINRKRAAYWYKKAADQGHTIAKYNLAICYQNGDGVDKDLEKAFNLVQDAAIENLPIAQTTLGLYYEQGIYVKKDSGNAIYWYKKAIENDDEDAQEHLNNLLSTL